LLPALAAAAPTAAHLVIYHSAVMAHMPTAERRRFTATVLACSQSRALSWIQVEPRPDRDPRRLRLTQCAKGRVVADHALGQYQPHGQWLRCQGPTAQQG